ncbi:MAG: MBL fold metallo-hydrolase [Blautia sp.]|nr:MBL fold metallo-hydrolase [Blautia sp.]
MYELMKVTDHCFYIQSPAKIGLIRTGEDQVCLIDSGNDKDAGKKVKRILDENGWKLQAIYNTHSHADHIGGNQYLQKQTGCRIYAKGIERCFAENPLLEPSYLYGGNPAGNLRHKFLMAQRSEVLPLEEGCLPEGMEMIPLPGHSWDMAGFRTSENIVYLADALSSRETLEKYQITFLVDVQACLDTLEAVRNMKADLFIPAHAEPTEDIAPLAELNIKKIHEIGDIILEICSRPSSFETILKELFNRFQLTMTFEQHALVGSTTRSYLTWLTDQGKLQPYFDDNTLIWR